VKLQDALDAISTDGRPTHVYSQPYETADGTTVIAVAKVRGKVGPVKANSLEATSEEVTVHAKPVGVFVLSGGDVKWEPAVDATAIALVGVLTGLVAATFATLAMVRRPPWPDIRQFHRVDLGGRQLERLRRQALS
jgi:hypothetical protein